VSIDLSTGPRLPAERTTREVREHLADVVNAAIRGQVTYITCRGRRVAAVVPLATADQAEVRPPSLPAAMPTAGS
jgi:prevent-host-death family protein